MWAINRTIRRDDFGPSLFYNGLPVCAMRERVNRYTVNYWYMLTASATYGKMLLIRKGLR